MGSFLPSPPQWSNKPFDPSTVVVGEVGLGGEIRSVTRIEARIKEAIHLGFERCILPKRNLKGLSSHLKDQIKITGVEVVEEAVALL